MVVTYPFPRPVICIGADGLEMLHEDAFKGFAFCILDNLEEATYKQGECELVVADHNSMLVLNVEVGPKGFYVNLYHVCGCLSPSGLGITFPGSRQGARGGICRVADVREAQADVLLDVLVLAHLAGREA